MLTFEEAYETIPGNGWLSVYEARLLWDAAKSCVGPILEVGSHQGRSTVLLAQLGRPVYAVDPLDGFMAERTGDELDAILRSNLRDRGLDTVTLFRQRIEDWEPLPVGFAFLDGDHSHEGTLAQIEKARQCHYPVISIHDVNESGGGAVVRDAAISILGQWSVKVGSLAVWDRR